MEFNSTQELDVEALRSVGKVEAVYPLALTLPRTTRRAKIRTWLCARPADPANDYRLSSFKRPGSQKFGEFSGRKRTFATMLRDVAAFTQPVV